MLPFFFLPAFYFQPLAALDILSVILPLLPRRFSASLRHLCTWLDSISIFMETNGSTGNVPVYAKTKNVIKYTSLDIYVLVLIFSGLNL